MRPVIARWSGAGLRAGEAVALDWRDLNLATGTLTVGRAKTDVGSYREVDLPGGLIEALSEWKASRDRTAADDPVLTTRSRSRQSVTNGDHRMKTAIKAANVQLEDLGIEAISERVTRTRCAAHTQASEQPVATIPCRSRSKVAGRTLRSCTASIRGP
jgi:integrase